MPSTTVASAAAREALLASAGPPLACALFVPPGPPLAAAGRAPGARRPRSALTPDRAESGGAATGGAGLRGPCGGGAMMPLGRVSWSSLVRSSALDVTAVGEARPELSGLSVRLSKPSSL